MSIANLLTSDKQFTNLPQITSEKVILRGGLGNGELTTNTTGTEAFFNGVPLATGTPAWVGTATSDLDMQGYDIKDADTLEVNEIALRDGGGIGVIKYSNAEPQIELGTNVIAFGTLTANEFKVSDAGVDATIVYDSASAILSTDKAFASAVALTAPVLEMIDGVATAGLTYDAAANEIQASTNVGISAIDVRGENSLQIGDAGASAQITYDGTTVAIDKPLEITGAFTASGAIEGATLSAGSISVTGAIEGGSLDVGTGSITCGTINYSALNPPIASTWVGTATSDLDMKTFNITSSTSDVTVVATAGHNIVQNAPVQIKLQNAGADKLVVSSAGVSALAPLAMNANNVSGVGTLTASIVTADDVRGGEVDLVDSANEAISLQKRVGVSYPTYATSIGGLPTASILDDVNNKPTFGFDEATKVLALNAKDVAGNTVQLSTAPLATAFGAYIPLAGTEAGSAVTGAIVFENTANIQCEDIQTGLISALPTVQFISIEDPVQTRVLGVRSEDGTAAARILMALSETAVAPDILQMSYNPAGADALEVNKEIIANGVNLNDAIAFKDANEFFVSSNGSDTTGNGSANAPFATIQKAIDEAEASAVANAVVNIMAGVYSENLTISKGSIILTGNMQSDRAIEGVAVNGKITINITDVDNLNNNQIILTGFLLSGQIEDISTKQHTVIVNGMRIEADSALGGQAIYVHPTSTDQRTFVQQCVITQEATMLAADALVDVRVGWLQMTTCDLAVRTLSPCINIGGSAILIRLYETTLESSSTSGSATALLTISSSTTTPHNIAQNTFTIASTVPKADTPAIRATSAVPQTLVCGQNFFSIAGTSASTNIIKYSTAPTVVVAVANNRAVVGTASAIQSGATVVPLTFVGETFITSVSAGTGIGVSTTGGVATVSNTGVTAVSAGSGISTTAGTGSITLANTGVLELTAGTNVTITGTKSNYTISATAGAGGVSDINGETGSVDIVAGSGIDVSVAAGQITISNTQAVDGVQSVSAGDGISVGGTATDPIISNTGLISASAGTGISVSAGVGVGEVVIAATGIQAITAGTGLSSTSGTSPTLSITDTAVSAGSYTVANITVNQQGQITSASNGTVIAEVGAGDGIEVAAGVNPNSVIITNDGVRTLTAADSSITVAGTANAPTVALPNQVATTGVFAYPAMTVNGKGIITAIASQTPVVSVNTATGALTVAAGTGIGVSTVGSTITISNTAPESGVASVSAGTGITLSGTSTDPVVNNDGVLTLNSAKGALTVAAGSGIDVATVGNTITISNTAPETGVQSVTAGTGITITGTATDPIIAVASTGTVTFDNVVATDVETGRVRSTSTLLPSEFSAYPRLSASVVAPPTLPEELAPVAYVDALAGVQTVTAGDGITITGTASDPIVSLASSISATSITANHSTSSGLGSIQLITDDPLFSGGTVVSMTYPSSVSQNATLYMTGALSIVDAPNGGQPASIIINGSPVSLGGGVSSFNTLTGDVNIVAGTNVSFNTVGNDITINASGGGGGGVASVTAAPSGGIFVDNSDPANPSLSNAGVLTVNSFVGDIEIKNNDGFIGVANVAASPNEIVLSFNGVQSVTATDSTIVVGGTPQNPTLQAKIGGSAVADADFGNNYAVTKTTGLNTLGNVSLVEVNGFSDGYALKTADSATSVGVNRVKVLADLTEIADSQAVMYDDRNYAPSSPCLPSGFQSGGAGGTLANGGALNTATKTLIAVQTITLTSSTFPYFNAGKYFGLLGNLSLRVSGTQPIAWSVEYKKNAGSQIAMTGSLYYTNTAFLTVPVNGITYTGIGGNTFVSGDIVTIYVYATNSGTPMTLTTAPAIMSAVYSALAV